MKIIKSFIFFVAFLRVMSVNAQFTVQASVDHVIPNGVDILGGITLSVTGGTPPYTYTWMPSNLNSKDLLAVPRGQYTVTVKDASTVTATYTYNIGYKTQWASFNGTKEQNDSLLTIISNWSYALSKNTLPAYTDGWFEYVLVDVKTSGHHIGFLDSAKLIRNQAGDIDFGVYAYGAKIQRIADGIGGPQVNYKPGDVLKVERIGTTVNYRLNNTIIWTATNSTFNTKTWKLKAQVASNICPVVNLGCSFNQLGQTYFTNYVLITPNIIHSSGNGINDGSIALTANEHISETYTWQPGNVINSKITGLGFGTNTINVNDHVNTISSYKYSVGYKTQWTDFVGTFQRGDTLFNNGNAGWARAVSTNTLPANTDGWVELMLTNVNGTYQKIGFLDDVITNTISADIDLGFYKAPIPIAGASGGSVSRIENGVESFVIYWNEGDIMRLERVGNTVNLRLNTIIVWTKTDPSYSTKSWRVKAAIASAVNPLKYYISSLGISVSYPHTYSVSASKEQFSQCPGSSIYLYSNLISTSSSGTPAVTFTNVVTSTSTWQPGNLIGNSYVTPTATTTYTVYRTAPNGSVYTQTVLVTIINVSVPAISYSTTPYPPSSPVTFSVNQTGPTGGNYSALPNSLSINVTTGLITATASPYGTYTVSYSIANLGSGCGAYTATTIVNLIDSRCPVVISSALNKFCPGDIVTLTASNGPIALGNSFTWTPSTGLSCTVCSNPTLTVTDNVTQYTITSSSNGTVCGSAVFSFTIKTDCEKDDIIGCCFSNYGAAVTINDQNTYLNVYCNLVNELGQYTNNTIKKGEFQNTNGNVRVLLDWIHNAKNNLYITTQGNTSLFGYFQKMRGNSNTYFNKLWLNGSGTKSIWVNEYATSDLDFTSNLLSIQNYTFYMTNPAAAINLTSGYASMGTMGYFSRSLGSLISYPTQNYLYPVGSPASSLAPFRYRPLEMQNNDPAQSDEISANFMNTPPSLITDNTFVNAVASVTNVVTDQSPSVLQINNAFYHKIKKSELPLSPVSNINIKSYYFTSDGQFQSISEWEKDPSQIKDWWGTTPGSSGSTITSVGLGTSGMLYAQANGTLNYAGRPFTLSRGGFYVNTAPFGNNSGSGNGIGTIVTLNATSNGVDPTPAGGGLNNPFGTGSNSGNTSNGGSTIFTPNPVAGEYVMTVTPPNDCAIPSKIKFVIDQNGNISPSTVQYGADGVFGYYGELSGDVYTIDNQNSGITFSATPRNLLKNCVNTITVTTNIGSDYVLTSGDNIKVSLPAANINSITYGQLKIYNASNILVYTSATLLPGINTVIPSPSLPIPGVYRFELPVSATSTPAISETLKGQIITK
jgi:hypothetical protein